MPGYAAYEPHAPGRGRLAVAVRAATPDDLDAVGRLQERAGRAGQLDPAALGDPDRLVVVATDARGALVGWAQAHLRSAAATVADPALAGVYLGGITVDPPHRRRGVGTALTDARVRWAAGRADAVLFVVNPANRASLDLHRRWGFVEVARGPLLAGVTFDGGTGVLLRAATAGHETRQAALPDAAGEVSGG